MRFEVNVDDGAGLNALHKARAAYNEKNAAVAGFTPAHDMPTYVQRLMDQAVAASLEPLGPTTLGAAMTKIAELQAAKVSLEQEVAALTPAVAEQVKPATPT
jgi:hypothetical protein